MTAAVSGGFCFCFGGFFCFFFLCFLPNTTNINCVRKENEKQAIKENMKKLEERHKVMRSTLK